VFAAVVAGGLGFEEPAVGAFEEVVGVLARPPDREP
jgi:hypothetical protein